MIKQEILRKRIERRERLAEVNISAIRMRSPPNRKVSGISPMKIKEIKLRLPKIKIKRCKTDNYENKENNEAMLKLKLMRLPSISPLKIAKKKSKQKSYRNILHH